MGCSRTVLFPSHHMWNSTNQGIQNHRCNIPQIKNLMKDKSLDESLKRTEKPSWEVFKEVLDKFLDKHKAPIYRKLVENMLEIFRNIGCNMSLNCTSFTVIWIPHPHPHPQSNLGDISDLHGERFHHHISTMVKCYHRKGGPAFLPIISGNVKEKLHKMIHLNCVFSMKFLLILI